MTQTMREAALRPGAAELYPFLPARMWTAAAHLTELVARYRGICAEACDRGKPGAVRRRLRVSGRGRHPNRMGTRSVWLSKPSGSSSATPGPWI